MAGGLRRPSGQPAAFPASTSRPNRPSPGVPRRCRRCRDTSAHVPFGLDAPAIVVPHGSGRRRHAGHVFLDMESGGGMPATSAGTGSHPGRMVSACSRNRSSAISPRVTAPVPDMHEAGAVSAIDAAAGADEVFLRFIPARAGNTGGQPQASAIAPVHPRAGGEHDMSIRLEGTEAGSSPRGRGTPNSCGRKRYSPRFIPARAGNTASKSRAGNA